MGPKMNGEDVDRTAVWTWACRKENQRSLGVVPQRKRLRMKPRRYSCKTCGRRRRMSRIDEIEAIFCRRLWCGDGKKGKSGAGINGDVAHGKFGGKDAASGVAGSDLGKAAARGERAQDKRQCPDEEDHTEDARRTFEMAARVTRRGKSGHRHQLTLRALANCRSANLA